MDPQANRLAAILQQEAPAVFRLLSTKGRDACFPRMGILAQTAEAKEAAINATIGQALEDDGSPMALDVLTKNVRLPREETFLYSPSHGQAKLRELWRRHIGEKNPSLAAPLSLPIVAGGITHALFIMGRLFLDDGDELILADMMWENYGLIFETAKLATFPLFAGGGFNLAGLESKLAAPGRKKAVLLNFPNNPTGYTPTVEEAHAIALLIRTHAKRGKDILVIIDDAYTGLVYEKGVFTESLFALLCGIHENVLAVKLDGITKEMFAWGLRVGFITYGCKGDAAAILEDKTAAAVRATVSNASTHSQSLALRALASPDLAEQRAGKHAILKERCDAVKSALADPRYAKHFTALPFNSGYFMCVRLAGSADGKADAIRKGMLRHGVGVIAIGGLLRVAFSSVSAKEIPLLFETMYEACEAVLADAP